MIRFLHAKGSSPTKFHHETVLDFSQDGVKKKTRSGCLKKNSTQDRFGMAVPAYDQDLWQPYIEHILSLVYQVVFFYVITINEVSFLWISVEYLKGRVVFSMQKSYTLASLALTTF